MCKHATLRISVLGMNLKRYPCVRDIWKGNFEKVIFYLKFKGNDKQVSFKKLWNHCEKNDLKELYTGEPGTGGGPQGRALNVEQTPLKPTLSLGKTS